MRTVRGAFRYLRCIRVTAGRGGTIATGGITSLPPSRCSEAAEHVGTEGTGPGLGPGDPEGSRAPEGWGLWVRWGHGVLQCLNKSNSCYLV